MRSFDATDTAIRLERTLPASPHAVYRAWLEPKLVRRWMDPSEARVIRVEIDERPGGAYRTWKADESGRVIGGFDSELVELREDERLVFRWGFIGPERRNGPYFETLLTVTLRPDFDGTVLTLAHEQLDELEAAMPEIAKAVPDGWKSFLDNLAVVVASGDGPDGVNVPVRLTGVARELANGPNQAHLATLLPDGSPHSVPVWIGIEGDHLAFLTDPNSRKARNIGRDPRVAISITDRDQPFTMTQIRGRVVAKLLGDEGRAIIDTISYKYIDAPYPREHDRVVFLVQPEHVHGVSY
jgi:PPOX class probable F420-dependent enzyme